MWAGLPPERHGRHYPAELAGAISSGAEVIEVQGTISGAPMITLPPGGDAARRTLEFGAKGVRLTKDNTLDDVTVLTTDGEVAILNRTGVPELGALTLRDVTARGQVLLVADDQVRAGHIQIAGLHVRSADVRGRALRPHGLGVEALHGGHTIWNCQADPAVHITAEVLDVSVGTEEAPVRGSGVFVGGHGDWNGKGIGGVLAASQLRTRRSTPVAEAATVAGTNSRPDRTCPAGPEGTRARRGDHHAQPTAHCNDMTTGARGMDKSWHPQIQLLDRVALEELKGKVQYVAAQPDAADRVSEWRAKYGNERVTPTARSFVVVGQTLMFLHTCPDGVVLPFAAYPDATVKVYTDVNHARESFYTDAQAPPAQGASGTEGSA